MSTTIRPELSEKNKFWIERHRYYELKHFCLQYPIWKSSRLLITGLSQNSIDILGRTYPHGIGEDPTVRAAEAREFFTDRMNLVEHTAKELDPVLGEFIFQAVTEGYTYEFFKTNQNIPCSREVYYDYYREFFWQLNVTRK